MTINILEKKWRVCKTGKVIVFFPIEFHKIFIILFSVIIHKIILQENYFEKYFILYWYTKVLNFWGCAELKSLLRKTICNIQMCMFREEYFEL